MSHQQHRDNVSSGQVSGSGHVSTQGQISGSGCDPAKGSDCAQGQMQGQQMQPQVQPQGQIHGKDQILLGKDQTLQGKDQSIQGKDQGLQGKDQGFQGQVRQGKDQDQIRQGQSQGQVRDSLNASVQAESKGSHHYLKGLRPVLGKSKNETPREALKEYTGRTNDLNDGFEGLFGKMCWLVPEFTDEPAEAATGFQIMVQDQKIEDQIDIASGTGGKYRYMVALHEQDKPKVVDASLFRTNDKGFVPTAEGFNSCSRDLNEGRGGDFLYIAWHTAQ